MELVLLALHLREEAVDAGEGSLAAQHNLSRRFRQLSPGHVERHAQLRRVLAKLREPGPVLGAVPGVDGAFGQAEAFVGNDQVQVEVHRVAEALAAWAGAVGIVEAEQARLRLAAGAMATLAFIRARKAMARVWGGIIAREFLEDDFAGLAVGDLRGIDDARAVVLADDNPVQ